MFEFAIELNRQFGRTIPDRDFARELSTKFLFVGRTGEIVMIPFISVVEKVPTAFSVPF